MTGNRFPFVGSGRQKEGGELATRKQDFNAHWEGNGFRHTADDIDMNPPIPSLGGSTVQQTLEQFTALLASTGTGFISIGNAGVDGYAVGIYNMNTIATPTLKDAFNAAFADPRLQNGGIILLMAGTYVLTSSVTVPPGISIIGEVGGTLIIGEMAEQSMFIISSTVKNVGIGGNTGGGPIETATGSNVEKVRFSNLMLADNLNGNVASGGASMITVPMVALQISCNFECNNVTFLGRINDGPISNRPKSFAALWTVPGGSTGTTLTLNECFVDGFKVAVLFDPELGDIDYLNINKCKFRTYGTEGFNIVGQNTCIATSLCNINVTNSYYVGAGTITNTFLYIFTTGGTTNVRVVVTNNSGSPSSTASANLIVNNSGVTFTSVVTGNNWGNEVDSPWYIVVGGASGSSPLGDIFGPNAINIILSMSNNNYQGTVIINSGTYTVTGGVTANNFTNLKFIGNKIGKKYPVLNMQLTAVNTDSLLNKFLVLGNHIEAIQFVSIGSTHSIRPSFNASSNTSQTAGNNMIVRDCIFTNTTLYAEEIGFGPFADGTGRTAKLRVLVENCSFHQDAAFSENVSMVLPPSHIIRIKDCNFYGVGYAASIGNSLYTATNFQDGEYTLENVIMDKTGFGISTAAPGSAATIYFVVNDTTAKLNMTNCQILANNAFGITTLGTTLAAAGTFTKFISISCKSVNIDHCTFNGPVQNFTFGGIQFAFPCLQIQPLQSCRVSNSRFLNGGLPLQITGAAAFGNAIFSDGVYVENNTFINQDSVVTTTLLDFDIDVSTNTNFDGGHIFINGNSFKTLITNSPTQVRHTEQNDQYFAQGIVQVYAPFFDVKFIGNKVYGTLTVPSSNPYLHFSGFVANTWNGFSAVDGASVTSVIVSDNHFDTIGSFNGGISTESASCCWVKAPVINVNNNYFGMQNTQGATVSFTGCLYLEGRATNSGAYTDCIVSNNIFARRAISGASVNLSHGYIYIPSTSTVRGMIVDNSFDQTTYDGASTALLNDNSADANKWVFTRNKNQQVSVYVKATAGVVTNSHLGNFNELLFNSYNQTDIQVFLISEDVIAGSNTTLQITSNGTGEPSTNGINIKWRVNLYDIIPAFTHIVSISLECFWNANIPAVGTDSVFLTLVRDGSVIATDTDTMHANANLVRTLGPLAPAQGIDSRLDYSDGFVVYFATQFATGTAFTLQVRPFLITYKW